EPDGSGLALSERFYEMTGLEPGVDASEARHPDDYPRVTSNWAKSPRGNLPFSDECRLRMANGEYRVFRLRAAPLHDDEGRIVRWYGGPGDIPGGGAPPPPGEEGRIVRWYGMTEDIHEGRAAESAHREVEERYRLAVQATNDAVWDYDVARG